MKLVGYGFLLVFAAMLVTALIVGTAFKLIGLLFMAALVVLGVTWVMGKIRGPRNLGNGRTLTRDHPLEQERLPR